MFTTPLLQPIIDTAALDAKEAAAREASEATYSALRDALTNAVTSMPPRWPHPFTETVVGLLIKTRMWEEAQEVMRVSAEGDAAANALTYAFGFTAFPPEDVATGFRDACLAQQAALLGATNVLLERLGPEPLVEAFVSVLLSNYGHIERAQELLSLAIAEAESVQARNDAAMAAAVGKWETELTTGEPAYLNVDEA